MTFAQKLVAATSLLATANAHRFLQSDGPCAAEQNACMADSDCLAIMMSSMPTCEGTPDADQQCTVAMTCTEETGDDGTSTVCNPTEPVACDGGAGCVATAGATDAELLAAMQANTLASAILECNCNVDPTCGGEESCPCTTGDTGPTVAASGAAHVAPAVMLAFAAIMAN